MPHISGNGTKGRLQQLFEGNCERNIFRPFVPALFWLHPYGKEIEGEENKTPDLKNRGICVPEA
jgi:hypothetical protein